LGISVFRQAGRGKTNGKEADALQKGRAEEGQKGQEIASGRSRFELTAAPTVTYNQRLPWFWSEPGVLILAAGQQTA
jgi:hypothetical protein